MKVPPWGGDSRGPKGKNFVKKNYFISPGLAI